MSRLHRLKQRKTPREIKQELRTIYTGVDGKMPDLSKLSFRGSSSLTRVLIKIIVFLCVISLLAWTGFFLFSRGWFEGNETLTLTIEGPETVLSGEEVSYTFKYENTGNVPIANLVMELNIPASFHVYSTLPEAKDGDEWQIGSLTAGSDGSVIVNGVFLSEVPSTQRIQALFTYKPANFSSEFQDIVTHKVTIEESVAALSLSGPQKALSGDQTEYIINIQNTGTDPIYNLRVIPSLPTDFTLSDSDPEIPEGETYWTISSLDPGELEAITMHGTFTSTASGEQTMAATVGFVDEDLFLTQTSEELVTDVLGGTVVFGLIINGSNTDQTTQTGETLRLSINFENNSDETVRDLTFILDLEGQGNLPIDWDRADMDEGTRSGNTITFSGDAYDLLSSLGPSQNSVIDVSIPLTDALSSNDADTFVINLKAILSQVGSITSTREIEATPITIRLNSDASVTAHARYYSVDGTTIGSGPLPPRVGQTTGFRVYWNLSNGLHALDNIELSTTLPQDVTWLENTDTDIGTVSYNPTTRQVTWAIPRLPIDVSSAGAWFEIAINPDDNDVGTFMKLTNATSFSATDSQTKEGLSDTISVLTTELKLDEFAAGKGVVLE